MICFRQPENKVKQLRLAFVATAEKTFVPFGNESISDDQPIITL